MKTFSSFLVIIFCLTFASCEPDVGPPGPQGPQGPQGNSGPAGQEGNANVDFNQFFLPFPQFSYASSNDIYKANAPSSLPTVQANEAVIAFLYISAINSQDPKWVALPYTDYFSGTNNTSNFHSFGIDENNRLDFMMRNSTGGAPYSNSLMNSPDNGLNYRVFIIESSGIHEMNQNGVDMESLEEVQKFLKQAE